MSMSLTAFAYPDASNSQADDIKKLYGLETIVINDDTPRDDTYWKVRPHLFPNLCQLKVV